MSYFIEDVDKCNLFDTGYPDVLMKNAEKMRIDLANLDVVALSHELEKTVQYIKELNPDCLHACHCTDFHSKLALPTAPNIKEVGVGLKLEYI